MSFFTALLDAAGGFGAGRQQRLQNQQEQTRLNQEQQFRTAEERRQDATLAIDQQRATRENNDYQANAGIDPATQRPFLTPPSVSQIVPNNKGRGGTPTPQQMIAHYDYVARWAAQTHQTNLYNWAKNQQAETLRQMDAAQTQAGEDHREELRIQAEEILQDRRSSDEDRGKPTRSFIRTSFSRIKKRSRPGRTVCTGLLGARAAREPRTRRKRRCRSGTRISGRLRPERRIQSTLASLGAQW